MNWEDWAMLAVAMMGLTVAGKNARAIVRRSAPFYALMNIMVVGGVYGALLALAVFLVTRKGVLWSPAPIAAISILGFWGLLSAGYVGFRPDPIDWANKAQQTGGVAMVAYVVTMAGLLLLATKIG